LSFLDICGAPERLVLKISPSSSSDESSSSASSLDFSCFGCFPLAGVKPPLGFGFSAGSPD